MRDRRCQYFSEIVYHVVNKWSAWVTFVCAYVQREREQNLKGHVYCKVT